MGLHEYFLNHFETCDNPKDKRLQTHYYRDDPYHDTKSIISNVLQNFKLKLIDVDDKYNEMLFENRKIKLIVTCCKVSMYETRVDLTINTSYVLPLKRGVKIIEQIYLAINKKLSLQSRGNKK